MYRGVKTYTHFLLGFVIVLRLESTGQTLIEHQLLCRKFNKKGPAAWRRLIYRYIDR